MTDPRIRVAPSILSADFGAFASEATRLKEAGADAIHLDVMDGHFVPNLTFGPQVVAAIRRSTDIFLDAHLMMYNPYDYVERFVESGANMITIHAEATEDVLDTLKYIRRCGIQAGLALNPETSVEMTFPYLEHCDMVLLMTVSPGFAGQDFQSDVLDKIRVLRLSTDKAGLKSPNYGSLQEDAPEGRFSIQVDGGINLEQAQQCIDVGANILVSGSHLFAQEDMATAINDLRGLQAAAKK